MFYSSEESFIDKFIACLKKAKVSEIPFDNNAFFNGVEKMSQYFESKRGEFSEVVSDEISLLFVKNPFEKNYSRFRNAISEQNGWYMSFENPEYTKGIIRISDADADIILNEDDLNIPVNILNGFADEFCKGADITIVHSESI